MRPDYHVSSSPVGYLVSRYPAPSHTFVLREVLELRRSGIDVRTFSVRRTAQSQLLSEVDRQEAATTESLLPTTVGAVVGAHLRLWRRRPMAWLATAAEAVGATPPGARALLWQLFYLTEAVLLYDRCRRLGVRHVHAHLANVGADVAWLATRIGQRCDPHAGWQWSFTMHGPTELSEVERFNLRRKVEASAAVVCISDYCRSQLMRIVAPERWPKLRVVRCGVDTTAFAFVDRRCRPVHPPMVLSVGRLVPDKAHVLLLEAAALVRDAGISLRVVLAGDGPERLRLQVLVDRLRLGGSVEMIGAVPQDRLVELYREADIFCLPSLAEGLPIVLMEAMATGLPVVATSVAGVPELVRHGESGLLVEPGRVAPLTAALLELAESPELRHEIGASGRAVVEANYDLGRNASRLSQVLFDTSPGRRMDKSACH